MMELTTTAEVVEKLGGLAAVAEITGRKRGAAYNWPRSDTFPANTYLAMITALHSAGYTAPASLWSMVPERVAS